MAVIFHYFSEIVTWGPIMSQWMKLDPCCLRQKCSQRISFSEIYDL